MVVCPARDDTISAILDRLAQDLTILDDLLRVPLLLRHHPFAETHSLRRYDILERAALHARENRRVECLCPLFLA